MRLLITKRPTEPGVYVVRIGLWCPQRVSLVDLTRVCGGFVP